MSRPRRLLGQIIVGGIIGWYVVSYGLLGVALIVAVFVLVAQRSVLDRRQAATPTEVWLAAACFLVAAAEVDAEVIDQARSLSLVALIAIAATAVVGAGMVHAHRVRGPAGARHVAVLALFGGSIVVMASAYQSGAELRWWPVWLVLAAVLLQVRRRAATGERRLSGGRWSQRLVAGAVIVAIVAFLAAPLGDAVDYLPRVDRNPRSGGGADPGADAYWGFGDGLDTSVRGDLSDKEVLRVRSDMPRFWRAATYDAWDGRVWTRSDAVDWDVTPTVAEWRWLDQHVEVRQPIGATVIGAPSIAEVAGGGFFVDGDGRWRAGQPLGPGASYDVRSVVALPDAALLRSIDPSAESIAAIEPYRRPLSTTARVRDLARETTATATNDYDRIQSLIGWIEDNVAYDRDAPVPAAGADAVDVFLFEDRVGFCEQIASALVVMARELGIPARLAVGFVPGEQDGSRTWISRGTDAHAWAEVFFPGVGWVGFDPTAEVPLAGDYDGGPDWMGLLVRIGIVIAVLAIAAGAWYLWRRRRTSEVEGTLTAIVARFSAIGQRRPSETLREYGDRLAADLDDGRPTEVAWLLERNCYGVPPDLVDTGAVTGLVAALEVAAAGAVADGER